MSTSDAKDKNGEKSGETNNHIEKDLVNPQMGKRERGEKKAKREKIEDYDPLMFADDAYLWEIKTE